MLRKVVLNKTTFFEQEIFKWVYTVLKIVRMIQAIYILLYTSWSAPSYNTVHLKEETQDS